LPWLVGRRGALAAGWEGLGGPLAGRLAAADELRLTCRRPRLAAQGGLLGGGLVEGWLGLAGLCHRMVGWVWVVGLLQGWLGLGGALAVGWLGLGGACWGLPVHDLDYGTNGAARKVPKYNGSPCERAVRTDCSEHGLR
jgi:hypothetical protein